MRLGGGQRLAAAACGLVALAAPLAIAAQGPDEKGGAANSGQGERRAFGYAMKQRIPAEIDERPPGGFVSSDVLRPLENAWRTASHRRLTEVDAGARARDASTGLLAIFRHEFVRARQDVSLVRVKDSGPLRITSAPLGRGVQRSAQRNGKIGFVGARGVRGTLDLSDDTVRLHGP
jgi:hypothetical protein